MMLTRAARYRHCLRRSLAPRRGYCRRPPLRRRRARLTTLTGEVASATAREGTGAALPHRHALWCGYRCTAAMPRCRPVSSVALCRRL